jgi:signal transduction histidine kinase
MERAVLTQSELASRLRPLLDSGATIPLLVLRVADGGMLGTQMVDAFARGAERIVREDDVLAHEPGSHWFGLAMLAPARATPGALSLDARSALERIAATMSLVTGRPAQTGWWPLVRADIDAFERTIDRAIERGARDRERFEFLAAVGHELRTPLTSIRGYLETVLDDELDPATARRFLDVARSETLRLGRLVEGILDIAPLDRPSSSAAGTTDVAAAVRSAIDVLDPIAREAGVRVTASALVKVSARIGHDACMHVLLNVIENAIKYGRPGGLVAVSLEYRDACVCIVVDDDGPGITRDERDRIFDRGTRGVAAGTRRGSGLGLAIARGIVERVAGSVAVHPSPLGGARFVVRIPVAKADSGVCAS